MDIDDLRVLPRPWGEGLFALVPALRMAALAVTRRSAEAEDLLYDGLLEALVRIRSEGAEPILARLVSVMRTAHHTRTRVGDRLCPGAGVPSADEARRRALATRLGALPAEEREALVLVGLLGIGAERVADAAGCSARTIAWRGRRAREQVRGEAPPASHAPAAPAFRPAPVAAAAAPA